MEGTIPHSHSIANFINLDNSQVINDISSCLLGTFDPKTQKEGINRR